MNPGTAFTFKVASTQREFEQIQELNYQTFVEEIPQHETNPDRTLVDRFHPENTYLICLDGDRLVGMAAVRSTRPFSLDLKLADLDRYLPPGRSICEIRLLSVQKRYRHGMVFAGLARMIFDFFRQHGFDLAIISGTVRQKRLYEHLGFVPFGPQVGAGAAVFQPMYLTVESLESRVVVTKRSSTFVRESKEPVNLLPGPVAIRPDVRQAMGRAARSHRSGAFQEDFQLTQKRLCELTGAGRVEILLGSGTLANDAVAAQLALTPSRGLVLCNGEFGERLADHASRAGLEFETLAKDWGGVFDQQEIERALNHRPDIRWMWAVHCETSTGVLNDIDTLKSLCASHGVRLCLDCTSSIGAVPVNLSGVFLATGVSGKGLGAFPGLSMVFYHHEILPSPKFLPRYLDIGLYAASNGIPFTHSSNLLAALQAAVKYFQPEEQYAKVEALSQWVKSRLRVAGFQIVAPDAHASPAVITLELPRETSSKRLGNVLREKGFHLSFESEYLLKRNWVQICLMGDCSREKVASLLDILENRPNLAAIA